LDDAMKAHPRFALELGIATADNPLPSSQGQLMARLKEMEELERLGRHTGEIRVTRSPVPWYANGVKVLGTGLVIYGGAMTIAELRDAKGKPNQREREGEALGAFVGSVVVPEVGVALCVFVGLAAGGIALLPVVILLGVAGAAIGRQVGGAIGRKLDSSPIPLARNGPRYSHDDGIAPIR
jgi:hypothetical protein